MILLIYCILILISFKVAELIKEYTELEENVVDLRNKSKAEMTSFLDDEIGSLLEKLSRQVARIETRLHTYHEVSEMSVKLKWKLEICKCKRLDYPNFNMKHRPR